MKRYGRGGRPALDDVSFEIGREEVVGLLGPNGAGKSTLLRILTCFLAPTRGRATLAGCSIADDPRGVRRAIGYLPEAVPLPPEMRVAEYLDFRAALKGVARASRRAAVDEASGPPGWPTGAPRSSERCRGAIASGSGWPMRCSVARRS